MSAPPIREHVSFNLADHELLLAALRFFVDSRDGGYFLSRRPLITSGAFFCELYQALQAS
jgi:hypothetical protein